MDVEPPTEHCIVETEFSGVVLPKRNGPDLDDVPERVRSEMTFHLADNYADVAAVAFAS